MQGLIIAAGAQISSLLAFYGLTMTDEIEVARAKLGRHLGLRGLPFPSGLA